MWSNCRLIDLHLRPSHPHPHHQRYGALLVPRPLSLQSVCHDTPSRGLWQCALLHSLDMTGLEEILLRRHHEQRRMVKADPATPGTAEDTVRPIIVVDLDSACGVLPSFFLPSCTLPSRLPPPSWQALAVFHLVACSSHIPPCLPSSLVHLIAIATHTSELSIRSIL